uniref:Receptor-type tyrosine-protein phosphatase U-like Fn3 domain-containing protein n=1 Tax=Sphenodon punctatus TaxID=8508 RepID=A0A8D0GQZ6_SPHPU
MQIRPRTKTSHMASQTPGPALETQPPFRVAQPHPTAPPLLPAPPDPCREYQIIIAAGQNASEAEICPSQELQPFNSSQARGPYVAAVLPAHNLTGPTDFVIGDGTHRHGYYNAPLPPDRNYTAVIRVVSRWKQEEKSSCVHYAFSVGKQELLLAFLPSWLGAELVPREQFLHPHLPFHGLPAVSDCHFLGTNPVPELASCRQDLGVGGTETPTGNRLLSWLQERPRLPGRWAWW